MSELASACGIYDCAECTHRGEQRCLGCREGNVLLRQEQNAMCRVFECAESRGIDSCEACLETSCVLRRSAESVCPLRGRFENKRWWAGRMSRALTGRKRTEDGRDENRLSERVVARLRWYLTALDACAAEGQCQISSWQLAERVGVTAALIRKDLSRFGEFGTPSYGYRVGFLQERIRGILGLDKGHTVVWVGACAFRHHSTALERLGCSNLRVAAVFDIDAQEIGTQISGFTVMPLDQMPVELSATGVSAAVIAVPGPRAQEAAEAAVGVGAQAVLNLSGEMLVLPCRVRVRNLDVAGVLMELCYYC